MTDTTSLRREAMEALEGTITDAPATHRHVKRGSLYREIGRGKVQTDTPLTDYAEVVVYQGFDDGLIWVRPVSEFEDGRFEVMS